MRQKTKRLFGIILSLALVAGLMPQMSMVARATEIGTDISYLGWNDSTKELEEKTGLIQRTLETDRHLCTLEKLLDRLEAQFRKAVPEKAAPNAGSRQEDEANPDIVRLLQEARNEVHTLLKTEN